MEASSRCVLTRKVEKILPNIANARDEVQAAHLHLQETFLSLKHFVWVENGEEEEEVPHITTMNSKNTRSEGNEHGGRTQGCANR